MLGRDEVAVSVTVQLDVVRGAPADVDDAVAHRGRLGVPGGHRGPVAVEAGVVPDLALVHLRGAHVVEVLRDDGTQHGARPQVGLRSGAAAAAGKTM